MALNFPLTRENGDPLQSGDQYTAPNGINYIYDGVKWVGYASTLPQGTTSLVNNGHVVQVDSTGNLVTPSYTFPNTTGLVDQVLSWPASGHVLTWTTVTSSSIVIPSSTTSTLINGSYTVRLSNTGKLTVPSDINGVYLTDDYGSTISSGNTATAIQIFSGNVAGPYGGEIDLDWSGITLSTHNESFIWTFDINGNINLPEGGDVKDYNGVSVLSTTPSQIVNTGYTLSIASTGEVSFPQSQTGDARLYTTSSIGLLSDTSLWRFNKTGNLSLPSGGQIRTMFASSGTEIRDTFGVNISTNDNSSISVDRNEGVNITTNAASTWTFTTAGSITLPSTTNNVNFDASNANVITLDTEDTVTFMDFSGMVLINDLLDGNVYTYIMGNGSNPVILGTTKGSLLSDYVTFEYDFVPNGYVFTNKNTIRDFNFVTIMTRAGV